MVIEWADTGMIHQGLTCFDKGKWRFENQKMGIEAGFHHQKNMYTNGD